MFYVYLLRCADGTLYCGYTDNVQRRLQTHNSGKGAKYTRGRLPAVLVYYKQFDSKAAALQREYRIKRMPRHNKLALISGGRQTAQAQKNNSFLNKK